MDLSLYRVTGGMNRIALGALADGIEFFTAEKADNGTVTLTPVRVVDATAKRGTSQAAPVLTSPAADDAPWDDDEPDS